MPARISCCNVRCKLPVLHDQSHFSGFVQYYSVHVCLIEVGMMGCQVDYKQIKLNHLGIVLSFEHVSCVIQYCNPSL
jgi:hypothetical protein